MISYCGDPDCEGIGVCPCQDWSITQKKIGAEIKQAWVQFKELKESIGEEEAFKLVLEPILDKYQRVE